MSGTKAGGLRAAKTNKEKYGQDFYSVQGAKGGSIGRTGGFYYSKVHGLDTHIKAGAKGGKISRRGPSE